MGSHLLIHDYIYMGSYFLLDDLNLPEADSQALSSLGDACSL